MGVNGRQVNEDFGAASSTMARVSSVVVEAAAVAGCTVVAVGPGQYRLTRSYRKGWVVPAAVIGSIFLGLGLLLLLIPKVVEECTVSVSEDRRGVKVRMAGVVPQQFVTDVQVACSAVPTPSQRAATPPTVAMSRDVHQAAPSPFAPAPMPSIAAPPVITPSPSLSQPPAQPQYQPQVGAASWQSWGPVDSAPAPAVPPAVSPASSPSIRVGQRVLAVAAGVTVGRNPQPVTGLTAATLMPIDDVSLSKTHASFRVNGSAMEVCDNSSTNGTRIELEGGVVSDCVAGTWVSVPHGATVLLGDQRVVVV